MLDGYKNAAFYESVFWCALEPVLFERERRVRPVLERMRPAPAETELKLDAGMTTDEIVAAARRFFYERYGLYGEGKIRLKHRLCGNRAYREKPSSLLARSLSMLSCFSRRPFIDPKRCVHCGVCVEHCPVPGKALSFRKGKEQPPVYDRKKCIRWTPA